MCAHGSFVHQKCSNYALTNLLFGLYKSVWIIDPLVTHPTPHLKILACPFTPKVLWVRERISIPSSSVVFTFILAFESYEKLGGVSLILTRGEAHKMWQFLWNCVHCFAEFSLKILGKLKGQKVRITLDDDTLIFQWSYKLNDMEWAVVKAQTKELLNLKFVKLFKREYALTIVIPTKKDIFDDWIEHWMCENYRFVNKWTWFNKYAMSFITKGLFLF